MDRKRWDDASTEEAPPWCQHCWADPRYTRITDDKERRCPVCGSDYTGPRRPSLANFFGALYARSSSKVETDG